MVQKAIYFEHILNFESFNFSKQFANPVRFQEKPLAQHTVLFTCAHKHVM